jgi:hypothetical protein
LISLVESAQSITTSEVYVRNNLDGTTTDMTKDDWLIEVLSMSNLRIILDMESKPISISLLSNNAYREEIINYMKKVNCNRVDLRLAGG